MISALAGIGIALSAAASVGLFIRGASRKNKRPTIGSILVALFGVPFAAASVSGLTAGPLELLGHVPGLSLFAWGVATSVLVVLSAIGGHFLASVMGKHKDMKPGEVMRGAQLSTADRWQKRTQRMQAKDAGVISLAGLAIDRADEAKHFLLMGTTGTGKSVAIRELLRGAAARGDRAIIADPDGGFLSRFYDAARGDIILNPFDARSASWDMMGEVPNDFAAEQLAASLIPSPGGTADATWAARSRTLLTAILRRGRQSGITTREVYRLFAVADRTELRTMLAGTAAEPFLAEGATRLFDSVRSSSGDAMSALEYAADGNGVPFSLTEWASNPNDLRWVFLPYRADQIAALKSLIGPWMRLAIFATMSRPEGDIAPTWFVADELDAIGKIEGLDDALQRMRKFGGRCVLGFQTIGKVRALYGDGAAAALIENCSTRLILRCAGGDNASTARFASSLIGQQVFMQQSTNQGDSPGGKSYGSSLSAHTEDAVLPSEIERLPDLSGYLKVPSKPEWFLAKVIYQEMILQTRSFVA